MILKDFLKLILEEEARIELEIDLKDANVYTYESFWLSDYRCDLGTAKYFNEYEVIGFRFSNNIGNKFNGSDIVIEMKER